MFRALRLPLLALAAAVLAGCSSYRLGTGAPVVVSDVFIAPVQTEGVLPQAAAVFTTQIREAFLRDGRMRVVNTPEEADAVLTVKFEKLTRRASVGSRIPTGADPTAPEDRGRARKFEVELLANCTLAEPGEGKVHFAGRPVNVTRQVFTDGGQQLQAEYSLVPQLAAPLAEAVRSAVVDTW